MTKNVKLPELTVYGLNGGEANKLFVCGPKLGLILKEQFFYNDKSSTILTWKDLDFLRGVLAATSSKEVIRSVTTLMHTIDTNDSVYLKEVS